MGRHGAKGTDADVRATEAAMASRSRAIILACIILHQRHRRRAARRDATSWQRSCTMPMVPRRFCARISDWTRRKYSSRSCRLSHAYEHSGGQFLPIGVGAQIYYAEGLEKLAANIEETRPTLDGCRAAIVRSAARAHDQGCRKTGQGPQLLARQGTDDRRSRLSRAQEAYRCPDAGFYCRAQSSRKSRQNLAGV